MKKFTSVFIIFALLCSLLAGCGSAPKDELAYSGAVSNDTAASMEMAGGVYEESDAGADTAALPENRKWIVTVDLRAETEELDVLTAALDEKIAALGGYVENQSVQNGSAYSGGYRYRSADMTVRIPADRVDEFTDHIAGLSNVVRKEKSLEDITLQYVDTQSRLQALETEQARLLELLAQAETMSDLLEIEARLTDVRYELESVTSRLRRYDNQVDYATIYLSLEEVKEYTPVEEPTLWERIRDGFTGSISGLWVSLQYLLVFAVSSIPYVVIYGGILLAVIVLLRKAGKKRRAKKEARQDPQ